MSHSFNRLWIHAIWSTKERAYLIEPKIEKDLYACMFSEFRELHCMPRIINGMPDHVHCLFLLHPQRSVAEVVKYVKGSSSHFINQNDLISEKFSWQTGYAAYSVSESMVQKVYGYIRHQKIHHKTKSFDQEFDEFLKLNRLGE